MYVSLGKSFIVKHYYDMHMTTHNNEVDDSQLPYVCEICQKRFATSQFLVTHRFRHRTKAFTNDSKPDSDCVNEKSQIKVIIKIEICLLLDSCMTICHKEDALGKTYLLGQKHGKTFFFLV